MDQKNPNVVEQYAQRSKYRSIWQKIVRTLACIVVFCTTYALILPVITMEQNYFCGLEAHEHLEACYGYTLSDEEMCSATLLGVHAHQGGCYDEAGAWICGESDKVIHIHDEICYDMDGALWCKMEEVQAHTHTETCYTAAAPALVCTTPEGEEHTHGEDCYQAASQLALVCGSTEYVAHTHEDGCHDETGTLICTQTVQLAHQHTEECAPRLEKILICGLEEHTHLNTCSIDPNAEETTEETTEDETEVPTEADTLQEEDLPVMMMMMSPGPATVADDGQTYTHTMTVVAPDNLVVGQSYVIYYKTGENQYAVLSSSNSTTNNPYATQVYGAGANPTTIGAKWGLNTNDISTITWKLEPGSGENIYRLAAKGYDHPDYDGPEYLCIYNNNVQTWYHAGQVDFQFINVDGTTVKLQQSSNSHQEVLYRNGDWTVANSGQGSNFYLAVAQSNIIDDGNTGANTNGNYPHAVHTGKNTVKTLRFYNFATNNGTYSALPGCTFVVKSAHDNGATFTWSFTTPADNPATPNVDERITEIFLPEDIPVGHYTIEEVSVPDGYVRDVESKRTFSVIQSEIFQNTMVFQDAIGIFLNHSVGGLNTGKSAEVEDYNNRTYEIMLNAYSEIDLYEMEPVDVLFVVDQSNSMLFPSGLKKAVNRNGREVGTVTLNKNGSNNDANMNALNLDTSKVYYIIADPEVTSTVFAVWYVPERGTWWYQDASYYAKAKHNNTVGYQQPDGELAKFPDLNSQGFEGSSTSNGKKYKANGGPLGKTLGGKVSEHIDDSQKLGYTNKFQVYEAVDEYNRLHYLEQAVSEAIYQLAEANAENTVTIIRFTKEVDESNCVGPLKLTPTNAELLVSSINKIETSGGTRQDLALEHAYQHLIGTHKAGVGDLYTKDRAHTYTILITDGAPVTSSGATHSLGKYTDAEPNKNEINGASIYARIKGFASMVKEVENPYDNDQEGNSTLITVGLGMDAVTGGKAVLSAIADKDMYANLESAADLSDRLHSLLFSNLKVSGKTVRTADAVDIISDSFYPIAWVYPGTNVGSHRVLEMTEPVADSSKVWIILEPNDWISNQGEYVGTGDNLGSQAGSNAKGHVIKNANGDFQIEWRNRPAEPWEGHFFVKAKEDFVGGNAIDTNKSATIELKQSSGSDHVIATLEMPIPTVNVRLLDLNQMNSEVTVFLGDLINEDGHSPRNSLEIFFNNTRFTKLISGEGTVLNNAERMDLTGLTASTFDLKYAMGGLTEEQWQALMGGAEIVVPYTYDDASSHGPVGAFRFKLSRTGDTAQYDTHEATQAGMGVETYTLYVSYTAYDLSEEGRPSSNANNGTAGPGTEVGSAGADTLPTGLGNIRKENIHIVNVIPGSLEVTKMITDDLVSENGQTFNFNIHRQEDGENTENDIRISVVVPANSNTATTAVTNLKRGTYILTEVEDEAYHLKSMTATGNCLITKDETSVTFVMGTDADGYNVIGKLEGATYTSYIRENSIADPQHGVYGHAVITNEKTAYYGEIPVLKVWGNNAESHPNEAVYLVLYKDTAPVTENGQARILRLDASNDWNGNFRVALEHKDQSIVDLGYTVREATAVSSEETTDWTAALLENDRDSETSTVLYYEDVAENGEEMKQGGVIYRVEYERNEVTGALTVTNYVAYLLPHTGGVGTTMYTISGLSLMAVAALMYGYCRRRKCERGAEA